MLQCTHTQHNNNSKKDQWLPDSKDKSIKTQAFLGSEAILYGTVMTNSIIHSSKLIECSTQMMRSNINNKV
jgi:hypothetical protein